MNVMNINDSAQGVLPMNLKGQDNYEMSIQKQIANLQEQMKEISSDKEKSIEQKMSERQEIQKQIQNLNVELRQHQIQKRQEEAAKRQAAAEKAAKNDSAKNEADENQNGFSEAETGVLISLSATKEQIAGMKKVRTDLQGKLRTATTEKEQKELQEKIDNITKDIGEKVKETQGTISSYQKVKRDKTDHANYAEQKDFEESDKDEATMGAAVIKDDSVKIEASSNKNADVEIQAQTVHRTN